MYISDLSRENVLITRHCSKPLCLLEKLVFIMAPFVVEFQESVIHKESILIMIYFVFCEENVLSSRQIFECF